jgi:hypothetical protein
MKTIEEIDAENEAERLGTSVTPKDSYGVEQEPGWFQPGSKSDAAVRGFVQGSTLGLGKYLQAPINAAISGDPKQSYWQNILSSVEQEKANNALAADKNTGSYLAGNIAGALPQGLMAARAAATSPTLLGQVAKAAGVGGTAGAISGASDANSVAEVPGNAGRGAMWGAVGQGAGPVLGKVIPPAITALTKVGPAAEKIMPVALTGSSQVTMPALGALFNATRANVMDDTRPDWATDPYSAAMFTAKAGAIGAAGGLVAKAGPHMAGNAGAALSNTIKNGATWFGNKVGPAVDNLVETGSTSGTTANSKFPVLEKWFANKAGTKPTPAEWTTTPDKPVVPEWDTTPGKPVAPEWDTTPPSPKPRPVEGTENAPAEVQRKAAMEQQTKPEGRAQTNGESTWIDDRVNNALDSAGKIVDKNVTQQFEALERWLKGEVTPTPTPTPTPPIEFKIMQDGSKINVKTGEIIRANQP